MLCPSVSRAFMCLVLLLVNVISVRAPYVPDSLSDDANAAIARTYTLQAQLEQDSKDNPANAQANREKMSLLGEARTELARVYTTPLSIDGTVYESNTQFPDRTRIADDSEFLRIRTARETLIADIPATASNLGNARRLKERLATARETRSAVETERARLSTAKPGGSSSERDLRVQTRNAELTRLKTELQQAQEELETTGDAKRFIAARKALQDHQDHHGPLKSFNALTSSPEAAQAKKEFEVVAHATRVLDDAIKAKEARREETRIHEAHLATLSAQLETARDEMQKFQKAAEEKMLAHRNRVDIGKQAAAAQRAEEATGILQAEPLVTLSPRGPLDSEGDAEFNAPGSARSRRNALGFEETQGPDYFGGTFGSAGSSRPPRYLPDTNSSVDDLIEDHKILLLQKIAKYKDRDDYTKTREFEEELDRHKQQIKTSNEKLEELQRDTERRLPQPGITGEAEIERAKTTEDERQKTALAKLARAKLDIQAERDQAVEALRVMESQREAAKQLKQAEAELEELENKRLSLTYNFNAATGRYDGPPKTPEQTAAAQEDLRRELLARSRFEARVTESEKDRLMATAENDARRAVAERLFAAIDAYEEADSGADEKPSPASRKNLLAKFKALTPQEQIELTRYLQYPDYALPETADDSPHPFAEFTKAATEHSRLRARSNLTTTERLAQLEADTAAGDDEARSLPGKSKFTTSKGVPEGLFEESAVPADQPKLLKQKMSKPPHDGQEADALSVGSGSTAAMKTKIFGDLSRVIAGPTSVGSRSVFSGGAYAADGDSIPATSRRRDSTARAGSSPDGVEDLETGSRNLFAQMYAEEYESRRLEAEEQASSPLTRARLYKENPEVFVQARQEVDRATGAGSEDTDMRIKVLKAQETKALEGKSRSEQARLRRIKETNENQLNSHLDILRSHHSNPSEEQARQLMVLAKAQDYYAAIEETVTKLQRKLAEEQQSANYDADTIGAKIAQLQDDGEAVPEDLERKYDAARARIEAAKNKATTMIDAFKTDPVPFLTAKNMGDGSTSDPDTKATESDQLRIFRDALAGRGIEFWREEDVAPEITNALNLLKNPEAVLDDGKPNPVKDAAQEIRLRVRNLGDQIESGDIAKSLAKAQKGVDDYKAPTALSLKKAAVLKKTTSDIAANLSPERARATATTRVTDYRTTGKSEPGDDLRDAPRSIAPIANLVILQSATDEMIRHGERGIFLMTEEEAGLEIVRRGLEGAKTAHVTLDLTDLSADAVEYQLRKSLLEEGFKPDAIERSMGALLPRQHPQILAAELDGLKQIKEEAVAAVQEKTKALALLAAKRKDPMFKIAVRVDLGGDDDDEEDDEEDDYEDTAVQKKIKHFDLFKADYLEKIENPDTPKDEIEEAHRNYQAYLRDLLDEVEPYLKTREYPFSRENRELLLALSTEALEELERPGVRDFNTEDLVDTRKKAQSLALTHLDAVKAENKERKQELATPSAMAKRAQIEDKQRKLDEEIRAINKSLTEHATEEEILEAHAKQQRLREKFSEESHELVVKIREDLQASAEERIASLTEEAAQLRNLLKGQNQDKEAITKNPRIREIAELLEQEERVRVKKDPTEKAKRKQAKAEESKAVARRLASDLSARSGPSIASSDRHKLAEELTSAGRSFRKDRKEEASARKSARPTPRPLTRGY